VDEDELLKIASTALEEVLLDEKETSSATNTTSTSASVSRLPTHLSSPVGVKKEPFKSNNMEDEEEKYNLQNLHFFNFVYLQNKISYLMLSFLC